MTTCTDITTVSPGQIWAWQLDDLGFLAEYGELRRHLAGAPPDADPELVAMVRARMDVMETRDNWATNTIRQTLRSLESFIPPRHPFRQIVTAVISGNS